MLKNPSLFQHGFHLTHFPLSPDINQLVQEENWDAIDKKLSDLTSPDGSLFRFLQGLHDFSQIEYIISIRDSKNAWEEDGIWHDDGSRFLAFSLSLTLDAEKIQGGRLSIRQKGDESFLDIPTPSFGGLLLFLTGFYGFEHKINKVSEGKRVVIAGWCS